MGIPRPVARLLFEEGRRRPFSGSVLQVGRCFVYLRWDELTKWALRDNFPLRHDVPLELSHEPELAAEGCISDRTFFRALGFDVVESLDLFDDERPTYLHDMNQPVPQELEQRFDVVFEPGSLVHVFDQRVAFRNLARLAKPEGRVIHATAPSSNHVDLGLYMFSPTLLADFYTANRWRIESLALCEFEPLWFRGRFLPPVWRVRPYRPGVMDRYRLGGLGWRPLSVWAVATKVAGALESEAPIQGCFRVAHEAGYEVRQPIPARAPLSEAQVERAARAPAALALAADAAIRQLKRAWRRLRRSLRQLPPVVARL